MAMEFRLLRSFTEVVRCGGFSQAARSLASTQSTISKAVKQLENELGTILLDRSGHRCVMTPAGEVVYRRGIKLLADRDDVLAELDEIRGLQRGVLRLGIPSVGNIKLFAPVVCTYRERYPQIELRLIEHGSNQLEKHLRAGDIDIAGILEPQSPDFEWEPIRSKPIVALLSSVHPLSRCGSLKLTDLRDVPFVLFDLGFRLHGMILNLHPIGIVLGRKTRLFRVPQHVAGVVDPSHHQFVVARVGDAGALGEGIALLGSHDDSLFAQPR